MVRLDSVVAERARVTRAQARALIMEGRVRVDGEPAAKAGQNVRQGANVEIERPRRFVSRGGEKLEAALDAFGIDVRGADALDVGASTGGFTDCLLQRGAEHVTALDVGYGQLDWRLRNDRRVTVMERTNFRVLPADAFTEGFDIITIDVSFISLRPMLARAVAYLREHAAIVALVKPQFEAGRELVGKGGVVRDPSVHRDVLRQVVEAAGEVGLAAVALASSPLRGPSGNREFLLGLRKAGKSVDEERIDEVIAEGRAS